MDDDDASEPEDSDQRHPDHRGALQAVTDHAAPLVHPEKEDAA